MKKIMMVAIILIASVSVFAQTKITGFGKLQLSVTVKDIPELSEAKRVNNNDYFTKVYGNKSSACYESVLDTTYLYSSFGSLDKRVRIFQIGKLQITENIELKDVTLKFFNDTLYSINIKDSKVDELLTIKYGTPKEDVKTKDNTFVNGYGAKFVKTDLTKTHTWETNNPNTVCWYTDMSWYNDKGEFRYAEYCVLYDKKIDKVVSTEEDMVKTRVRKREEDKKKALAAGF